MPDAVVDAVLAHASDCHPLECCGVVAGGAYRRLTNLSARPGHFVMDMRGYIRIARRERIETICHSHVGAGPAPSDLDRAGCEQTGLPWLIVSWPDGDHRRIEPNGWTPPLTGRPWQWGSQDCFGLVRDGLQHYAGIAIPDIVREWGFWDRHDLIDEQFAAAGFRETEEEPRHLDVLAMRVGSRNFPNHLGLFLEPGIVLHQLLGRPSVRQPYDDTLQRLTVRRFRHEALG